ncbi:MULTISPECIES: hypothetical protein [Halomonadaceae]|uniref:hypothetical protein n=1 Tax=Halomonadaceae TaxID=28256 RepID=UPI00159B6C6A|nr:MULTISPECIES: hypothetical protein [Halomonas]QJQ95308.1 hypothetical protein HIO72_08495 [Halomonas sp. PA5]
MLNNAIEIREVEKSNDAQPRYEVYDTDTGTSLGLYDSMEKAEAVREKMVSSDNATKEGGYDADPAVE